MGIGMPILERWESGYAQTWQRHESPLYWFDADWLQACKGGPPASSNFEYGARLCEFVMLGVVAVRARRQLKWYAPNMKATNVPEADRFLRAHYRKGWELPV